MASWLVTVSFVIILNIWLFCNNAINIQYIELACYNIWIIEYLVIYVAVQGQHYMVSQCLF